MSPGLVALDAEQKRQLWAMTPEQRIAAMRAGQLTLGQCLNWASRRPEEVPMLNGVWEFIAVHLADFEA